MTVTDAGDSITNPINVSDLYAKCFCWSRH